MRQLETSTLLNQDISSALLVHTYTTDADRELYIRLFADQIAGNGNYVAYVTIQRLGAGSEYQVVPITTAPVASGRTEVAFATIAIPVKDTDVLKVYLTGLAGDTTTPDIITEVWAADNAREDQVNNIGSGATGGTHVQATYDNTTRDTIDNAGADLKGGGLVGIPVTGHTFVAGREITIAGSVAYNGAFDIVSQTANEVVITHAQTAEAFTGAETIVSSIKGQIFVGTITSGTFADVLAGQGDLHSMNDVGDDIDIVYGFNIGGDRQATLAAFLANVNGNADEMSLDAYDFVGGAFASKKLIPGSGGTSFLEDGGELVANNTGTGTDLGDVFIRFRNNGTTPSVLQVDKCLLTAVGTSASVGYAGGQIWVNTITGTAGTVPFFNGFADLPCLTWADALTLSASVGITDFHIINGSTITLTGNSDNFSLFGDNWTLQLNGQSVADAYFQGAHVSGVGVSATEVHYEGCDVATMSVQLGHFDFCSFSGTVTHTLAGDYNYHNCYSMVAGPLGPTFAKTAGQAITAQWRGWAGSINQTDLEAGDTLTIGGSELGTVDLGSSAGAVVVEVRGIYKALANVGSAVVNLDGAINAADVALILGDTNELQTDWTDGGRLDVLLDAIPTTAMRGTDSAALAATALTNATWTDARAGYLDSINGHTAQTGDSYAIVSHVGYGNEASLTEISGLITGLNDFSPAFDTVANVTNVAAVASLGAQAKLDVNAEVDTALNTAIPGAPTANSINERIVAIDDIVPYMPAAIYIDTVSGAAGTTKGTHGTRSNAVNSVADAVTLAASVGVNEYRLLGSSSIILTTPHINWTFHGQNGAVVDVGTGQNTSGSHFECLTLTGDMDGNDTTQRFCKLQSLTNFIADATFCLLIDNVTESPGDHYWLMCGSGVAGPGTPYIDVDGNGVNARNNHLRGWLGGVEMRTHTIADLTSFDCPAGQIVVAADSTGGTIAMRGNIDITDNASGAVTFSQNAVVNITKINAEIDTALTDYDGPTNAEMEARTLVAANYFDSSTDVVITDAASRTASKATGFAVAGDAMTLTVAERNAIADAKHNRPIQTNPTEKEYTERFVILMMMNSNTVANEDFLTVFDTADAEVAQLPVTDDADAAPITGIS